MTNSLASDIYTVGQKMADNLNTKGVIDADVTDGLTTLAGKILDIPNKAATDLEISVPLNLEYGDNFNIGGTLTSGESAVSGALVKLKVGSTVVDSDSTDSNGEVTFTQCPVATGTHTFQLVFEGDITYNGSESTAVTRDVSKETSVVIVNTPSAGSNHYTDAAVSFSGSLVDNDSPTPSPLSGKTIKVLDSSDNVLTTATTQSDGSFSGSVTLSSAGSTTLKFKYEGDSYYTASTDTKTITMVSPSISMEKTGGKDILSYADSGATPETEYCTITFTLNASVKSGQAIDFYVNGVKDTSASTTTDSNGQASYTYTSRGIGDVTIKAECISLTKTYEVYDEYLYRPTEWNRSVTSSGTDNYAKYDDDLVFSDLPTDFEMSWDMKSNNQGLLFGIGTSDVLNQYFLSIGLVVQNFKSYTRTTSSTTHEISGWTSNTYHTLKIVKQGTTVSYYANNNLIGSDTITWWSNYNSFTIITDIWNTATTYVKNLKIKPL